MPKLAIMTTALLFACSNLALAVPAGPALATGQALSSAIHGDTLLVRNDKKSKKVKSKKVKKSSKKSGGGSPSSSGGGMNMPNMPPGHKM